MRAAAENAFFPLTVKFEGKTPFSYLDVKGLVTTAIGILADSSGWDPLLNRSVPPAHGNPWDEYVTFPWFNEKNEPATKREMIIEWCWIWGTVDIDGMMDVRFEEEERDGRKVQVEVGKRVDLYDPQKNAFRNQRLHEALQGGFFFKKMCKLHLTEAGIAEVAHRKLAVNVAAMKRRHAEYDSWPASAQLALQLLVWACGAGYRFPKLDQCLGKREFAVYGSTPDRKPFLVGGAAVECKISEEGNAGVHPRNLAMKSLFEEAYIIESAGLDRDALYYPNPVVTDGKEGDSTPPIALDSASLEDTAPYPAFGTQNPDVINEAVKAAQADMDKKRGEEE